jgi:phosphate transport system substrate-binding protein
MINKIQLLSKKNYQNFEIFLWQFFSSRKIKFCKIKFSKITFLQIYFLVFLTFFPCDNIFAKNLPDLEYQKEKPNSDKKNIALNNSSIDQNNLDKNSNFFSKFFSSHPRNQIQLVGSSTLYPFMAIVAENFGLNSDFKTPIVEATGTGGGFKLFCSGIGLQYPDFVNASRKIKNSEIAKCLENNIKNIGEIKIGYDGIVLANSKQESKYSLTLNHIFLAVAKQVPNPKNPLELIDNPYHKWQEIDQNLPNKKIAIYGPPSTSGTRDAFVELVLQKICNQLLPFQKIYFDEKIRIKKCQLIRSDGAFIEAGENDNLIVAKLKNNHDALGIFGFNFLEDNKQILQASKIDGVEPSFESIIEGSYKISRPLFVYFKKEHLDLIFSMRQFVGEIISKNTLGFEGYLMQKGLIPLTDLELKAVREQVEIDLKN